MRISWRLIMLSTFWTHNLSLDNVSHLTFPWEKGLMEPQLLFLFFSWTEMDGEKPPLLFTFCEERKIKLSVNVYIKIARNLGSNFWNFGSNFLDFWQFFSNFLAFQWATFQHFTSTIGIGLHMSSCVHIIGLHNSFQNSLRNLHNHKRDFYLFLLYD